MSLRTKFWVAFALIATLACGLAAYGRHALQRTGDLVVRLYDEPLVGVSYARAASITFSEARRLMDHSLMTPSRAEVASLRAMAAEIAEDLRVVRQRIDDVGVTSAADRAERSIAIWFSSGTMVLAPPPGGALVIPLPATIDRQGAVAHASLDDLVEEVAAHGFTYRARAQAEISASNAVLASLAGGIIVMSALFVLLLAQSLIRPIRKATRIATAVAAGHQANIADTSRRDEIGLLLTSLATMQGNLRSRDARALTLMQEKDRAADALEKVNLRFDTALNNLSVGVLMCDGDSRVVVVNRRFCNILGIGADRIHRGSAYQDVLALSVAAGNHPGRCADNVWAERALLIYSRQRITETITIAGGRTVATLYEPMPDGGWIATYEDITERRQSEEQIVFLARHDALTELPNRVLFRERLGQALSQAERGSGFALLWLDLDRFKAVNDVLGHPAGDSLLREVAGRLQHVVRAVDTVARLGGDEFAVLQVAVSGEADAAALARRIVEAIARPYDLEGHQVVIGASIGIVLVPSGSSAHPIHLMKDADVALYRSKQSGRGTWRFYEAALDTLGQAQRELEHDLGLAMSLSQFELHYQPIVGSQSQIVTGFEALLRWRHPTRGLVPPGDFIPVAEEMGIIGPIGTWVLRQATTEAATWPDHLRVAINLSPRQFRSDTLVCAVEDALKTSGIRPERLELEITESVPLLNDVATFSILHALHALGARIALDDFGTGYSSLSYLRSFPFDTIKIDRSFVSEVPSRNDCVAIVRAITALGASLDMNTTAEGVETEAQLEFLAAAGCTEIQGYLFGKPVPASALPALIERLSTRQTLPGDVATRIDLVVEENAS